MTSTRLGLAFALGVAVLGWSTAPRAETPVAKAPVETKAQIGYPRFGGRILKALRMVADTQLVSQARLATLSGVSATTISRAERNLDTLRAVEADALYRVLAPMVRQRFGDDGLLWGWVLYQRNP